MYIEPLKLVSSWDKSFLTHRGFPSQEYPFFGTMLDTPDRLKSLTSGDVTRLAEIASQFAGHIALRLVHHHVLGMNLTRYNDMIRTHVYWINKRLKDVRRVSSSVAHAESDCGSVRFVASESACS